jgi:predicted nucleic acid-binding Zn ribbon protein
LTKYKSRHGRKNEPTDIGSAIQEMLKAFKIEDRFHESNLVNSWEKVMGSPIAKRTSKIYIKDKKLFVYLTSAPLKHKLSMSKDKVLLLLTKEFGESLINEVIIK